MSSWRNDLGITARLVLALTVASAFIFIVVFWANYRYTASMVEQQVQAHARDLVVAAVQSIDNALRGVVHDQHNFVAMLEKTPRLSNRQVREMVYTNVARNDEIYGATISFEPFASPDKRKLFAPYFFKRLNGSIGFADLSSDGYDYPVRDWYRQPRTLKAPVWSEPYFDEGGGNVVMTTYAVPFYRPGRGGQRRLAGIATADVSIDWLGRQVSSLRLYRNGYAALFSRKGVYLAHPDRSLVLKESIFQVADKVNSPALREIGLSIGRQENGFVKTSNIYGRPSWIYYAPVPSTGWSLAVVFPAEAMLADVHQASRSIALFCAGGFALLLFTIVLVARTVTRPLVAMTAAVGQVAEGQLDVALPERAGGEVGQLARAVAQMQHDLKGYIERLTEATAVRERMASELAIASQIQHSFLPGRLPQLPGAGLAGCCLPAREVGGDFYDVIDLGGGLLFLVIGDVSGKGVPAALYMAATVTLVRTLAREQLPPDRLLQRLNDELARSNDTSMFVTIFCGYLQTNSGRLDYANAGHNPPLLVREGEAAVYHPVLPGLAAGCMEGYLYQAGMVALKLGDALLLYTDGVTEAQDSGGVFFSDRRLLEVAGSVQGESDLLVDTVLKAVEAFAGGASQADDITMLAIKYKHEKAGLAWHI